MEIPRKTPSKVINNSSEMKYEVFSVFKLDFNCKKPVLSEYSIHVMHRLAS